MEKNAKILFGGAAVLILAAVLLLNGQMTGKAVYCSKTPEITKFEVLGDTLSVDWKDTSTSESNIRYEIAVYQKKEDGSYDMDNPLKTADTKDNHISIADVDQAGTYIAKIRAKNDISCAADWSEYVTSKEVVKVLYP